MKRLLHPSMVFALLILGLLGCTPGASLPMLTATIDPTPSSTPQKTVPTPTRQSRISESILKNSYYLAPTYNQSVQLVDGKYENGSGAEYLLVGMLPNISRGDMNGDGAEDAAILLAENGGGSGVFVSAVAVLNLNGKPVQAGSVLIDDRPIINSMQIKDGQIVINAVIHGSNDSMANPTSVVTETFTLLKDQLILVHFTSTGANQIERSINIDKPKTGTAVKGSVTIAGSMPVRPFENNLTYRIYDEKGNKLAEDSFLVNSDDSGGPATFESSINLPDLPSGSMFRVEVTEISMLDGATLAMDAVLLEAK